jgi:hypothetical protein
MATLPFLSRGLVLLGVLPAVAGGLLFLSDRANLPAMESLWRELQRGEQLAADQALMVQGMKTTDRINESLVQGRLSLREAVEALQADRQIRPHRLLPYYEGFPGISPEERYLRGVIEAALHSVLDESRLAVLRGRLEAEMQEILAQQEGLVSINTDTPRSPRQGIESDSW